MLGGAWRGCVEGGVGKSDEGVEKGLDEDYCKSTTLYCVCMQELATSLLLCKMHWRLSFS